MKVFTRLCLLAVMVIAAGSPAFAQATIHGDLTKDWAGQKALLVGMANAMPEDKYGFKPTPAQRSFGEHVLHIAQVNMMLTKFLGGKTPEPAINMKATTKAEHDQGDVGLVRLWREGDRGVQQHRPSRRRFRPRSWVPRPGRARCSS